MGSLFLPPTLIPRSRATYVPTLFEREFLRAGIDFLGEGIDRLYAWFPCAVNHMPR